MRKKILITGGAGYIGSVCTELLISKGYHVIVLDNLQTGHRQAVDRKAEFVQGDIGNKSLTKRLFQNESIFAVMHFAGETLVDHANTNPHSYYYTNLAKSLNLLDSMIKYGCLNIVFSSTAAVYGEPKESPIPESHPKSPLNAYGESKLMLEKILHHYSLAHNIKYFIFRYFNAAGASLKNGENHPQETHLIPRVLSVASGESDHINILGNDYDTPDGTCLRDYVHVIDIASAHILALNQFGKRISSIFNLGNQTGTSVKKIVEACENVTGKHIPIVISGRRAGDPSRLIADSTLARKDLKWHPRHSTIDEIITSAWIWMKKHPLGYPK